MYEGEVDGYHDVECPYCGLNNWRVQAQHDQDGPYVRLECHNVEWPGTFKELPCVGSVLISIQQTMTLL